MTQKQIEILKSIEQEFNRINAQEVLDNNDLIAQIENRVDSKRKLRLELDVVDKANKRLFDTFKKSIVDKLMPITKKYGLGFEEYVTDDYIGLKIRCIGYKNNYDNYEIVLQGFLRYQYKIQDGIKYVHSPIPIYEKSYMSRDVTNEDGFVSHFVDGIVNALKTKV